MSQKTDNLLSLAGAKSSKTPQAKRVSIDPNPITIPPATQLTQDLATVFVQSTITSAPNTITGTLDPDSVLTSIPIGIETEHSYANNEVRKDKKTESSSDTSTSTSSESSSSEESEVEEIVQKLKAEAAAAAANTPTSQAVAKKPRGRPRKNPPQLLAVKPTPPATPTTPNETPPGVLSMRQSRKRGRGCGGCPGCLREDCGKCQYCMDKPKFGGPGKKKQRCSLRVCSNFLTAPGIKNVHHTPEAAILADTGAQIAAAGSRVSTPAAGVVNEIKQAAIATTAPPPAPPPAPSPLKRQGRPAVTTVVSSTATPKSSQSTTPPDQPPPKTAMMRCLQCNRERKLTIVRSSKFCTQRCLKNWQELHPGQNPEEATPMDPAIGDVLVAPSPPTKSTPRAIKNLHIDMAFPGTTLQSSPVIVAAVPAPQEPKVVEQTLRNGTRMNATTAPPVVAKRTLPQPEPVAPPAKKVKETSEVPSPVAQDQSSSTQNAHHKRSAGTASTRKKSCDLPIDVRKWSIKDVTRYFESTVDCRHYSSLLEEQEVDGPALLLVTSDTLVKCLSLKLGPALKVMMHVERLKAQQQAMS